MCAADYKEDVYRYVWLDASILPVALSIYLILEQHVTPFTVLLLFCMSTLTGGIAEVKPSIHWR